MGKLFNLSTESSDVSPPNPNPEKKSTLKVEFYGAYAIMEIMYFGCTTFNGRKLLLLKDRKYRKSLDPHLLGDGHPVIARFEPNEEGWKLARLCAKELTNE